MNSFLRWLNVTATRELLGIRDAEPVSAQDEADYQREEGVRAWRPVLIPILIVSPVSWFADRLYADIPGAAKALQECRAVLIVCACFLIIAAHRLRPFRSWPVVTHTLVMAVMLGEMGHAYGHLAHGSEHWFIYLAPLPLASLVGAWPLGQRIAANLLFLASVAGGYVLSDPSYLHAASMPREFEDALEMTVLATLGGVFINRIRRQAFLLRRKSERQATEVRRLNAELEQWTVTLEQRVEAQTVELRRLATHLATAQEQERVRIARELHDELGQELTGLRMSVALAQSRFDRNPESIKANLESISALAGNMTTITRQIVNELRPRVLDDLGLTAATEWLVKNAGERSGGRYTLSLPTGDLRPPEAIAVATFRIIQESLTNIARHSKATEAHVELRSDAGEQLVVTIRDNGVGMSEAPHAGAGLIGMRERARALSGELLVTSQPGQGTTVEARLPLVRQAA